MGRLDNIVNIEGDTFNVLRNDINQLLRFTLHNMIQKGGEKAELKMSLKITLMQGSTPDTEEEAGRMVIYPRFEHKVNSILQYKAERDGFFGGYDFELIWDKERMEYIMRPIQEGLFDEE